VACLAWLLQQQLLIIDPSGRLFANYTRSAFTEVINKQTICALPSRTVSNTPAHSCFLPVRCLLSFPAAIKPISQCAILSSEVVQELRQVWSRLARPGGMGGHWGAVPAQ